MKKGFTLIELLAVIAILAIVLLIAVPSIVNVITNVRNSAYNKDEIVLRKATENYLAVNQNLLPSAAGDTVEINLSTLQTANLITPIKDPQDNSTTCTGYVFVTKNKDSKYDYTPYLECGTNYKSSESTTSGLMAWYKFDGNTNDSSGNNRNGTLVGSPTLVTGKVGQGYQLNTNSDYITVPSDNEISNTVFGTNNFFTISVWAYPTVWEDWACLVNKAFGGSWSNTTAGIWASSSGFTAVMGANVDGNPAGSSIMVSSKPVLNAWYNIVAVADGTYLSLYLNGIYISRSAIASVTYSRSTNTQPITIGQRTSGLMYSFKGIIDEVRIYDRTLTANEISHNYNLYK